MKTQQKLDLVIFLLREIKEEIEVEAKRIEGENSVLSRQMVESDANDIFELLNKVDRNDLFSGIKIRLNFSNKIKS